MSATAQPEVPLEAAQALARHLREKPEDAFRDPGELAREFSLSAVFVEGLLRDLAAPVDVPFVRPGLLDPLKKAFHALRILFRRLTAQPLSFVGISAAASIATYLLLDRFFLTTAPAGSELARRGDFSFSLQGNNSVFLSFALATLVLHLACYFRHGMVRYPLFGGLACWLISAPTLMVLVWLQLPAESADATTPLLLVGISIGMLVLNIMYAVAGVFAAVLGGAWRIRQKDKERKTLGRQELLERMFDIQERLQASDGRHPLEKRRGWERLGDAIRRQPWHYAAGLGIAHSLTEILMIGVLFDSVLGRGKVPPLFSLVMLAIAVLWFGLLFLVGYFARGTLRAIFACWLFVAAGYPALLIPVGRFGPDSFFKAIDPVPIAFGLGAAMVVAAIASAGAKIEERAGQERKLMRNDPAALLAELVRLQWQLSPQTSDVCIMVVDAAGSAEMKAAADPWTVEYSFREYQGFLEDIVHAEGGSVVSTAGDGAVAEFPSASQAYRCARRIQTEIETFNRKVNRLDRSFRLRIGLHVGPVAGCINDVEFSAVIDVAAHVQAAAPVGGIALTGAASEQLDGEPLAQLAEAVDGQTVFLSMRPTMDVEN